MQPAPSAGTRGGLCGARVGQRLGDRVGVAEPPPFTGALLRAGALGINRET